MNFFDDEDDFESFFDDFFRRSPFRNERIKQFIVGEEEDRIIDFIEDEEKVYLIFELPGFIEKDISIKINGRELTITAKKSPKENIQNYLNKKLQQGIIIQKELPKIIDTKNFTYFVNNGVLEIVFNKIKGGVKNEPRKIRID
ncbi:MAG: Hsp20/alpha crystallin family protein [Candidatus Pacearchaeota archaeon]